MSDPKQALSESGALCPSASPRRMSNFLAPLRHPVGNIPHQLLQVREGVGTAIEAAERTMTYNGNGKLASLKDGENNLTAFAYDGHDRLWRTA